MQLEGGPWIGLASQSSWDKMNSVAMSWGSEKEGSPGTPSEILPTATTDLVRLCTGQQGSSDHGWDSLTASEPTLTSIKDTRGLSWSKEP